MAKSTASDVPVMPGANMEFTEDELNAPPQAQEPVEPSDKPQWRTPMDDPAHPLHHLRNCF